MMFIILNISDSDKHWNAVIEEYSKRLGKSLKIVNIKPSRNGTTQQMISKDTENIIAQLKKFSDTLKILLSKEGRSLDTLQFASLCKNKDIIFIIGGPYGFDEPSLASYIDSKIAFGSITLPHGLAKVTLLEQLYRISTIWQGKSYHY